MDVFSSEFKPPADRNETDGLEFLALLRADQYRRFHQGERRAVECYLLHFSASLDDDTAVDLIYGEWLLRIQLGEDPDFTEYISRFPQYESALREQLVLFEALQVEDQDYDASQRSAEDSTNPLPAETWVSRAQFEPRQVEAESFPQTESAWPSVAGYRILAELGRGSSGTVYQAEQLGLKRLVALKLVHAGADADTLSRFQREMEVVAGLRHRNIVQIYDVGTTRDGRPYFAMEWVTGGDLAQYLGGRIQPIRWAAMFVADLASAVQAAHDAGIVHRDLKPTNILLAPVNETNDSTDTQSYLPRIIDFGLAKQLDQMTAMTANGALVGTPRYMAPEQATGSTSATGPAADVHALGVMLYEAVTGAPPFVGQTIVTTLAKIINTEPASMQQANPRVHRDLETICLKCLRKEPAARYADARHLENDLRRFLAGEPIKARPTRSLERLLSYCRRRPASATAVLLGLVVLLVFLPGWTWYQFQLSASQQREFTSQRLVEAANKAKKEADKARSLAEELARTQEYFALINRVRERTEKKRMGWTWAGLDDLNRAAGLDTKSRDTRLLRIEAARCLAGVDVRLGKVLAQGLPQVMVAFHPEGKQLAVVDYRTTGLGFSCSVRLVETITGRTLQTLPFPTSLVLKNLQPVPDGARSVTFTPSGNQLLVGTRSGWLYRWRLNDLPLKAESWNVFPGKPVDWLYVPPNGNTVVLASKQHDAILLWDLVSNRVTAQMKTPAGVDCLVGVPNRNVFASESDDVITFASVDNLQPEKTPPINETLWPFVFDPTGEMLVGDHNDKIVFFHTSSRSMVRSIVLPKSDIAHRRTDLLGFNRDASLFVSLSYSDEDRTLRVWETAAGRLITTIVLTGKDFAHAAFHPTKDELIVAHGGKVELYEIGGLDVLERVAHQPLPVQSFDFMAHGDLVCTAAFPGPLRAASFWAADTDVFTGNASTTYWTYGVDRHLPAPSIVTAHPQSENVALLPHPSVVQLWNHKTKFGAHLRLVSPSDVHFDRTGSRLWTISDNQETLRSWHWPSLKESSIWRDTLRINEGTGQIYGMAIGAKYAALASRDSRVLLIRISDTRLAKELAVGSSPIRSVAINADESLVASGSQQGTVRLFSIPEGRVVASFSDHHDAVRSIDFHPSGKSMATGSSDGTMHLYELADGSWTRWITFRTGKLRQLKYHPNGCRLFFIVEGETAVRVWNLNSLKERLAERGISDSRQAKLSRCVVQVDP